MLRPSIFLSLLATCGALIPIACVQDFGVFEPGPSGGSGGGATTMSGSSSAGSSGTSSSGVGGSSAVETSCNDGIDNDSDGAADCADLNCTATGKFACVAPPSGWTGPIALFEGPSATMPSCPAAFPMPAFAGHNDLSAAAHTCNTCTCEDSTVTCTPAGADFFTNMNCMGNPALTVAQGAACTPITVTAQKARIPIPKAAASQCNPVGGGVTMPLPAATWATNGIGCMAAGPGKGCDSGGAGSACTPPLTAEFSRLCVFKKGAGVGVCPGGFLARHTYFENFADTRDCSKCGCGDPSPAPICTAKTALFASADCTGTATASLDNTNACVDASVTTSGSIQVTAAPTNKPTCGESGGAPTGMVAPDPASTITVCCKN